jgi:isoaspartyl peptidase/L-asparaginase-like protein (Ntn-hydrolase superfamily)
MTNKQPGRMGDTAIIGAGVYASEKAAVACTGHGETFIRHSVAHQIDSRMRYLDENIEEALASVMWQVCQTLNPNPQTLNSEEALASVMWQMCCQYLNKVIKMTVSISLQIALHNIVQRTSWAAQSRLLPSLNRFCPPN